MLNRERDDNKHIYFMQNLWRSASKVLCKECLFGFYNPIVMANDIWLCNMYGCGRMFADMPRTIRFKGYAWWFDGFFCLCLDDWWKLTNLLTWQTTWTISICWRWISFTSQQLPLTLTPNRLGTTWTLFTWTLLIDY